MPEACSFRQVEEKHVTVEVERMVWSPRMDLLALANIQAEVVLHRLSWQKVWSLAPPGEDVKVTALTWRPDGKVLAVGYSSGKVILCDVENATQVHEIDLPTSVTSLTWNIEVKSGSAEQESEKNVFVDTSANFLPKLPPFPKSYAGLGKSNSDDNMEDSKKLKGQKDLNVLLIGTSSGQLHMYAFGVFPVGVIDLLEHGVGKSGEILSACLSHDLYLLSILVKVAHEEDDSSEVFNITFETTLLASRNVELKNLALKFGQVLTLMAYLDSTIQQMMEAWEDILLEMDSKLLKFAEEKRKISTGAVSNDFLKLLMFGIPSSELQNFLLHDLTDKGLKKLGHSIETSYSNIQKLVLKHLHSVGQALVYHLAEIQGLTMWYDKYGVLGLSEEVVQLAVSSAGSFMLKASELQQVIDGSMKNFKAFFRWLYVVIKNLSEEMVPPELSKMTQQDLNFVAQFLKENFTEDDSGEKSGFKLEKVGQYLKNENLSDPVDTSNHPWLEFLEQNPNLFDADILYRSYKEKSLVQMHESLKNSINSTLNKCAVVIGQSLECLSTRSLFAVSELPKHSVHKISQFSKSVDDEVFIYTAFLAEAPPCDKCFLIRQKSVENKNLDIVSIEFAEVKDSDLDSSSNSEQCQRHKIRDISFYDEEMLSLLLQEDGDDQTPVLLQLPLTMLESDDQGEAFRRMQETDKPAVVTANLKCKDVGPLVQGLNHRRLENMKAAMFAVSGSRKVACVLFSSRRRVRLFMMDMEDEDEEEEDEEEDADRSQDVTAETSQEIPGSEEDGDEDKENSGESAMDL